MVVAAARVAAGEMVVGALVPILHGAGGHFDISCMFIKIRLSLHWVRWCDCMEKSIQYDGVGSAYNYLPRVHS